MKISEKEFLEIYQNNNSKEAAKLLGCSLSTLQRLAFKRGLKKARGRPKGSVKFKIVD